MRACTLEQTKGLSQITKMLAVMSPDKMGKRMGSKNLIRLQKKEFQNRKPRKKAHNKKVHRLGPTTCLGQGKAF